MGRHKINTPEILKKYKAEYYQRNKARAVELNRQWVLSNREKSREIKKKWQNKNPEAGKIWKSRQPKEKLLAYQKKYEAANPEKVRSSKEKWNRENRDYQKRYLKLNPEKFRVASAKRRGSKKSNSTPAQIDSANRKIIRMLKNKFVLCPYCEDVFESLKMHVDHILALNRGGAHSAENVTLACKKCNLSKGDKILNTEWTPPILIYASQN